MPFGSEKIDLTPAVSQVLLCSKPKPMSSFLQKGLSQMLAGDAIILTRSCELRNCIACDLRKRVLSLDSTPSCLTWINQSASDADQIW
jgi:hypothetical protein